MYKITIGLLIILCSVTFISIGAVTSDVKSFPGHEEETILGHRIGPDGKLYLVTGKMTLKEKS